jgi:hypothetical protein
MYTNVAKMVVCRAEINGNNGMCTMVAGYGDWAQLDGQLISEIFRRIPFQHRLGVCVTVCRAWRTAAVRATSDVIAAFGTAAGSSTRTVPDERSLRQRAAGLSAFLAAHGDGVSSLLMTADPSKEFICLEVPWQVLRNLRSLKLMQANLIPPHAAAAVTIISSKMQDMPVVSGEVPADTLTVETAAAELALLTALTSLQLIQCSCGGWQSGPLTYQLAALKKLQYLSLRCVTEVPAGHRMRAADATGGPSRGTLLAAALAQLTGLRQLQLELEPDYVAVEVVASLKHLTGLQELELGCQEAVDTCATGTVANICWSDLPASLTALVLSMFNDSGWQLSSSCSSRNVTSSSVVRSHLTALQKLVLVAHQVQPAMLSSLLPQLRHLSITTDLLQPEGAQGGLETLLSVIYQQHLLEVLELDCRADDAMLPLSDVALYGALTASSSLRQLRLSLSDLPDGAIEAMFSVCGQLPKLQKLCLGPYGSHNLTSPQEGGLQLMPLDPRELQMLLRSCPALEDLSFVPYSSDDDGLVEARWAALSSMVSWTDIAGQMTGLRRLEVAGPWVDDEFITEQLLMRLTGLQHLSILESQHLTDNELALLTCLTRLTELTVQWYQSHSPDDVYAVQFYDDPCFSLKNKVGRACRWSQG